MNSDSNLGSVLAEVLNRISVWFRWAIAVVFAAFFSYAIWQVLARFAQVWEFSARNSAPINFLGWTVLVLGVIQPVAIYVLCLLLWRKRSLLAGLVIMVLGLVLSLVFMFDLLLIFRPIQLVL